MLTPRRKYVFIVIEILVHFVLVVFDVLMHTIPSIGTSLNGFRALDIAVGQSMQVQFIAVGSLWMK